jgi:hypothetical protein
VRRAVVTLLVALLLGSPGAARAESDIPGKLQSNLIFRILTFDRNLRARMNGGSDVVMVVAFKAGDARSEGCRAELLSGLNDLAVQQNVLGFQVRVVDVAYGGDFEARASSARAVNVYACPGLEDQIGAITNITRKHSWLSFGTREKAVKDGLSIGLFLDDNKPTILVNLDASKKEGADLGSDLLRVAKVLKY